MSTTRPLTLIDLLLLRGVTAHQGPEETSRSPSVARGGRRRVRELPMKFDADRPSASSGRWGRPGSAGQEFAQEPVELDDGHSHGPVVDAVGDDERAGMEECSA